MRVDQRIPKRQEEFNVIQETFRGAYRETETRYGKIKTQWGMLIESASAGFQSGLAIPLCQTSLLKQ